MSNKNKPSPKANLSRRAFLRRSVLVGASAAGAATLPAQALAETETSDVPETVSKKDGYRMTEHIAAYYKTAEI